MMIARWHIDARFGHKQAVIDLMRQWWREIAPQIGWTVDQVRILTGALGAKESAIEVEVILTDLAALNAAWARLAEASGQAEWAEALEPHIVSGTPAWTVHRVT